MARVKHNTPKMVGNQTRPKKQGKKRIRRMIYRLYEAGRRWSVHNKTRKRLFVSKARRRLEF